MKDKKKVLLIVITIALAIIAVGVSAYIIIERINMDSETQKYDNLSSSYASGVESQSSEESTEITSPTIDVSEGVVENPIDFASLKQQNDEIYSWIYIPDTNINYPVCQSALDDNFYLDHDVYKNYSFPGTIYSQICNKKDYSDRVTVLYGHNMANGSMFANLHKYADSNFFENNDRIYVYTPDKKYTYEVVSAYVYDDRHIINSFNFADDNDYKEYLDSIANPRSVSKNVREGVELTTDDKILTLSTCLDVGDGRYLVQGRLIKIEKTE